MTRVDLQIEQASKAIDLAYQKINQSNHSKARLTSWIEGADRLALLQTAMTLGIFDAVREPSSSRQIAMRIGMEESRVTDICETLFAYDIFDTREGLYYLADDLALLYTTDVPPSLPAIVNEALITMNALVDTANSVSSYSMISSAHRYARAAAIILDPYSETLLTIMPALLAESFPELTSSWKNGGLYCEVGCGLANSLLSLLLLYPRLSAIGIDIDSDLLEAAQQSAESLGVANRVEWRCGNACNLSEEAAFETIFWAQTYFSRIDRPAVINAIFRALKPEGYLLMPTFDNPPLTLEKLRQPEGRNFVRNRLIYSGWDVPIHNTCKLREELEQWGFKFVRTFDTYGKWMLMKR